ncbi:MAG: hypothetical protein ABIP51_16480 [Bacteroidia bacterium]
MKINLKQLFLVLALLSTTGLFSQTTDNCKPTSNTIKGTYHGKNLMFENRAEGGIQKILINNKEVASKINSATFELPLKNLKDGEAFELKIIYCEMVPASYKILNPEVIK